MKLHTYVLLFHSGVLFSRSKLCLDQVTAAITGGADLSGADLSGLTLTNIDLTDAKLEG
jgi:uncharacterized protein YjbI with pentapeptide repeats